MGSPLDDRLDVSVVFLNQIEASGHSAREVAGMILAQMLALPCFGNAALSPKGAFGSLRNQTQLELAGMNFDWTTHRFASLD